MILWFLDRFGLPGSYYRIWAKVLSEQRVSPSNVRTVSLHAVLKGQTLLTSHGSRKAPTWVPDRGPLILHAIDSLIIQHKPEAVVLSAPESLACLGLHPEHATLNNLRGSVYWRSGIPHLVMLPMSAWNAMVTQRDIGGANYGFESEDEFNEGRQGTIHLESETNGKGQERSERIDRSKGSSSDSTKTRPIPNSADVSLPAAGSNFKSSADPTEKIASDFQRGNHNVPTLGYVHFPLSGDDRTGSDSKQDRIQESGIQSVHGQVQSAPSRLRDNESNGNRDRQTHEFRTGQSEFRASSAVDESGLRVREEHSVSVGNVPSVVGGRDATRFATIDGKQVKLDRVEYDEADADPDKDHFFYEPVLSPIGRFAITADVGKLHRILTEGKHSNGPKEPIVLNYR